MCSLTVIVYSMEGKAEEVREKLFDLQREYLINLRGVAIATRTESGKVLGAASSGLSAPLTEVVIEDSFMKERSAHLESGKQLVVRARAGSEACRSGPDHAGV